MILYFPVWKYEQVMESYMVWSECKTTTREKHPSPEDGLDNLKEAP